MLFIAFQTISFKSLGTDATKPLNFIKRQSPPPPVQCCVPFLVGFDVFWLEQHWFGWDEGEASGIVCKNCNDHLQAKLHVSQQLMKVIVWAQYDITSLYISKVQGIECSANEVFQLHFVHRRSNITL